MMQPSFLFQQSIIPCFPASAYLTLKQHIAIMTPHLKNYWHILTRIVVIAFAVGWFFMTAHQVAYHSDTVVCGHGEDGCAKAECVCICACHAALAPTFSQELCVQEQIIFVSSEYVMLLGTYVPIDIFRPPLVNS
jgi:hypothetical protein